MKIAVLSDTHGLLRPEVLEQIESCDALIHAGDIGSQDGVNFCVVHEKKDVPWNLEETQIVIYGHTHKYEEREKEGRLWLNPGSCGEKRFFDAPSMALLYLEDGKWRVEKVDI